MEFRCRLGTPTGEVLEGTYVAESESRLRRELEDKGLLVLEMHRRGLAALPGLPSSRRRKVGSREFLVFNQELATLLKAGMPLVQSLDILRQRVTNPTFKTVLDDVYERVRSGSSLSDAFEAQGGLFPGIYTASVLAGEKSGGLEQVLRRYVAYMKVVGEVKRKTISALIYPLILVCLSIGVISVIVLKAVPEFAKFYETYDAQLPLATRVLVGVSNFVQAQFLMIGLVLGVGSLLIWRYLKRPGQRAHLDRVLLRIPVAGPTARKFATSQLARTLATLLGGGIPLVTAIEVAARSISNRFMAQELSIIGQQVREGQSLAGSMRARNVFPDVAVKMVEVGESTGALQDMLNSLSDFYDEEIETTLSRFVTLIEPVMLVVMGLIIASLLLALYLPVFQLSSVVS